MRHKTSSQTHAAAMIPLKDSIPCHSTPVVTWSIMAVCIAIFAVMVLLPDETVRQLLYRYGMTPIRYSKPDWAYSFGLPPDYYLSFLTSLFLNGGWLHIASNMIFMWIFADNIEDLMGHKRFLAFYLSCGLLATYAQWLAYPDLAVPVVGASGAIAGVLVAYFRRFPFAKVAVVVPILFFPLFFEVPAIGFLGAWLILQLHEATTAAVFGGVTMDSAWWAHLGGFVVGVFIHPLFIDNSKATESIVDSAEN